MPDGVTVHFGFVLLHPVTLDDLPSVTPSAQEKAVVRGQLADAAKAAKRAANEALGPAPPKAKRTREPTPDAKAAAAATKNVADAANKASKPEKRRAAEARSLSSSLPSSIERRPSRRRRRGTFCLRKTKRTALAQELAIRRGVPFHPAPRPPPLIVPPKPTILFLGNAAVPATRPGGPPSAVALVLRVLATLRHIIIVLVSEWRTSAVGPYVHAFDLHPAAWSSPRSLCPRCRARCCAPPPSSSRRGRCKNVSSRIQRALPFSVCALSLAFSALSRSLARSLSRLPRHFSMRSTVL